MLPPILRRLLMSPMALLLAFLAATTVTLAFLPHTRLGFLPSGLWKRPRSWGYSDAAAQVGGTHQAPAVAPPPPLVDADSSPLPDEYAAWIPDLHLPSGVRRHPRLAAKLDEFLRRPLQTHDEALEHNRQHCPRALDWLAQDLGPNAHKTWEGMNETHVAQRRAELVMWIDERVKEGEKVVGAERKGEERGIVFTAGAKDTTKRCITAMRHLRALGVKLPIEVFHYAGELKNRGERREIEKLGGKVREVRPVGDGATSSGSPLSDWKNFQIKGLAMVQSSFREVLYLDSDNMPLRDPTHLFDAPRYADNGRAAFWPDARREHGANAVWRVVGIACNHDEFTFESGQMVVDKAGNAGLNLAALWLAAGMMDMRDFWFQLCGGDKDTYRWAWRILDVPYATPTRWMSALGFLNEHEDDRFCGHTTLQYDLAVPEGQTKAPPLFVHSNLLKHMKPQGLTRGHVFTHLKRMVHDEYTDPTLSYANMVVYDGRSRGFCLDLNVNAKNMHMGGDTGKDSHLVEQVAIADLEGRPLDGFEDAFFDEGGHVGGW